MLYPSIDKLLREVTPNRFKLVIIVSQRARDLDDGKATCTLPKPRQKKSIGIALEEINAGTIKIIETDSRPNGNR